MNRRSNKISGFVNFPVNDSFYHNTNEGGMIVELRVIPKNKMDWAQCCGVGNIYSILNECFMGDENKHYPNLGNRQNQAGKYKLEDNLSIPYLSVITLGSTGWSGSHDNKNREEWLGYWNCKYSDLTEKGKQIYDLIKELYGKYAELELCTILDT